jgi:hypothetical protein
MELAHKLLCQDVDWVSLTENRDQWQALVNMELNLCFHKGWNVS